MEDFQPIIEFLQKHQAQLDPRLLQKTIFQLATSTHQSPTRPSLDNATSQRKQVTVLFADIAGFTKWSETQDTETVHHVINRLFLALDQAILEEGGLIDKHMGDSVMALFGVGTSRENEPLYAVQAALRMQEVLKAELEDMLEIYNLDPPPLKLRIGLHTGPVLLGAIGVHREFTAMGDTVNLASRLEGHAPNGEILVSEAVKRHIESHFSLLAVPPLEVKGKSQPVATYLVKRRRRRKFHETKHEFAGIKIPVVGREAELQFLQNEFYTMALQRQCRMVTLVGEPGLGKSRLTDAFYHFILGCPVKAWVFPGYLEAYSRDQNNALLRQWLNFRFQILESDSTSQAKQKLRTGLEELLGDEASSITPLIGYAIGLDYSSHPLVHGLLEDPKQLQAQVFQAVLAFFVAWTPGKDVIYLLAEDVHWMDDGSKALLQFLLNHAQAIPIFILATTRPHSEVDRLFPETGHNRHSIQTLTPLDSDQIRRLLFTFLPNSYFPESFVKQIEERSGGTPYYLEVLLHHFIEMQILIKSEGAWVVDEKKIRHLELPTTLTGVIQSRVDLLPKSHRQIMAYASVMGRTFWKSALEMLLQEMPLPSEGPPLEAVLKELQQRGLIRKEELSNFAFTEQYQFQHAVVGEVVYENTLLSVRQPLHRQLAQWLVETTGERVEEYTDQIASHFEKAGEGEESFFWWSKAGMNTLERYLPWQALRTFQHCLDLLPLHKHYQTHRLLILEHVGKLYFDLAEWKQCEYAWHTMLEMAQSLQKERTLAKAYLGLAKLYMDGIGKYHEALEFVTKAINLAKSFGRTTETLVEATMRKGWAYYRLEQFDAAKECLKEGLHLSQDVQTDLLVGTCLNWLGGVYSSLGQMEQSIAIRQQALEAFRKLHHLEMQGIALNDVGESYKWMGHYEEASQCYRESLELFQKAGSRYGELLIQSNYAGVLIRKGAHRQARDVLYPLMELSEMQEGFWFYESCAFYAEALLELKEWDSVPRWAKRGLDCSIQSNVKDGLAQNWRILGQWASLQNQAIFWKNRSFSANNCFQQSWEACEAIGIQIYQAFTLKAWATHLFRVEQTEVAQSKWNQAKALFQSINNQTEVDGMAQEEQHWLVST